jgi:hypothetical protein
MGNVDCLLDAGVLLSCAALLNTRSVENQLAQLNKGIATAAERVEAGTVLSQLAPLFQELETLYWQGSNLAAMLGR